MEQASVRPSVIQGFPKSSHRLSAGSGVAAVILSLAAYLIVGTDVPTYGDSPRQFVLFYAGKSSEIELSALLGVFAAAAYAWFLGVLYWQYSGMEQVVRGYQRATPIALASGTAGVAISVFFDIGREAGVVAQGSVEPGMVRTLDLMAGYSLTAGAVLLSVFMLASFFLILVTGVLPRWLGYLAMLGTVLGVVQAVLFVAPQDDSGVLGALGYAWFFVFLAWVAGASITLVRRIT